MIRRRYVDGGPQSGACRHREARGLTIRAIALALGLCAAASGQQPNGAAGLYVQFRQGPPYPIVAAAPNAGTLTIALYGPPGAPFVLATGPLHPGASVSPGGAIWDLGTAPAFSNVQVLVDGTAPNAPASYSLPASGVTALPIALVPNAVIPIPPLQAILAHPSFPHGYGVTAASAVTLQPSKSLLFIQGDYDPGVGPTCRLADPSPFGFSALRDVLLSAGFSAAVEVVDTNVTVTPQLLAPHGIVVLGTNRKAFATAEVDAIENFVRGGGGLVSYADFTFGPNNVESDNQVLARFGLLSAFDNFGGPVVATSFAAHPIAAGLGLGVAGEGVSLVEIVGNTTDAIANVIPCASNAACFPQPVVAPSGSAAPTYTACAAVSAGLGRVVATFDRNTFFNWPGYGSNILDASNLPYAINLFFWVGGY